MPGSSAPPSDCTERLWPPVSWWVGAGVLALTVWLVLTAAVPAVVALVGAVVTGVVALGGLAALGSVRVGVHDGEFVAGRAHVPLRWCGELAALDEEAARSARGVQADARAFLLLRPYLARCVRVQLVDPADPTPYWLVSARRPERIVAAAVASRSSRQHDRRTAR